MARVTPMPGVHRKQTTVYDKKEKDVCIWSYLLSENICLDRFLIRSGFVWISPSNCVGVTLPINQQPAPHAAAFCMLKQVGSRRLQLWGWLAVRMLLYRNPFDWVVGPRERKTLLGATSTKWWWWCFSSAWVLFFIVCERFHSKKHAIVVVQRSKWLVTEATFDYFVYICMLN